MRPVGKFLRCTEYSGSKLGNTSPIHLGTLREIFIILLKLAYDVVPELKRRS